MLHFDAQLRIARPRQPVTPPRRIDVGVVELDAREVAGRPAARRIGRHRARSRRARVVTTLRRDLLDEAAPVEGLDARPPQPAHAERQPLQRRARILQLFEHQHRTLGEPQLAGQEQPDRAGPGDDHVVDQAIVIDRALHHAPEHGSILYQVQVCLWSNISHGRSRPRSCPDDRQRRRPARAQEASDAAADLERGDGAVQRARLRQCHGGRRRGRRRRREDDGVQLLRAQGGFCSSTAATSRGSSSTTGWPRAAPKRRWRPCARSSTSWWSSVTSWSR